VWAFGTSTLTLATAACGGISTGSEDASVEAGTEAAAPDAEVDDRGPDVAGGDAGEDDALPETGGSRCDVFIGVDYGAAPCR
jgi:hypothetical protein